jgi:hypothetical protein
MAKKTVFLRNSPIKLPIKSIGFFIRPKILLHNFNKPSFEIQIIPFNPNNGRSAFGSTFAGLAGRIEINFAVHKHHPFIHPVWNHVS